MSSCKCSCGHNHDEEPSSKEKVEKLKKAISELGFDVSETEDGEIKISREE